MFRAIKKYLPNSLYRRTLLILIIPTILAQSLTVYIFYERHWKNVSRHLAASLTGEVATLVAFTENNPSEDSIQKFIGKTSNLFGMTSVYVTKDEADKYVAGDVPNKFGEYRQQLRAEIGPIFSLYSSPDGTKIITRVNLKTGKVLIVDVSDKRLYNSSTYIFIIWMLTLTMVLTIITVIFLRNQIRPIIRLARLADNFGRGQDLPANYKLEGAKEIRQAASAFLLMRERLSRYIKQRTEMLAGISHDLRTPLTRMKMHISMMREKNDNEALGEIADDITEMETMVNSYLEFVRGDESEEAAETDLGQLIQTVLGKFNTASGQVKYEAPAKPIKAKVKPFQLSRAVRNLLENAVRYGTKAEISLMSWQDSILIIVDDNGPGIAANVREDVFRPFFRIEASRNKASGGIGLGLSIVRDIIHAHGGTVELADSEMGGLRAVIKLPE